VTQSVALPTLAAGTVSLVRNGSAGCDWLQHAQGCAVAQQVGCGMSACATMLEHDMS